MSAQNGDWFDGASTLVDGHDVLQVLGGNATWFNQFSPVIEGPQKLIGEALLWLFYNLGLCCVIVGDFPLYIGGMLTGHPGIITVYIAYHPQKLCPEISALLQISSTPAFSVDTLDFVYMPTHSRPGINVFYTVWFRNEITALRIAIVNSVKPCGPRSSINFTHYIWQKFAYPITNHSMVVLPSRTSGDKILYTRSYKAKIGGDNSRTCKICIYNIRDLRTL
jgi:hypothetical protein